MAPVAKRCEEVPVIAPNQPASGMVKFLRPVVSLKDDLAPCQAEVLRLAPEEGRGRNRLTLSSTHHQGAQDGQFRLARPLTETEPVVSRAQNEVFVLLDARLPV